VLNINRNLEIALATLQTIRSSDKPVRVKDVANKINASHAFLDRVVSKLSRAGITKSHRGPGGGVSLAKNNASVLEVAQALGYKDKKYNTDVALALRDKINAVLSQIEAS
jgi:DNA-binding IscR family transcriptional regulator